MITHINLNIHYCPICSNRVMNISYSDWYTCTNYNHLVCMSKDFIKIQYIDEYNPNWFGINFSYNSITNLIDINVGFLKTNDYLTFTKELFNITKENILLYHDLYLDKYKKLSFIK